jgi:hypothetical protein
VAPKAAIQENGGDLKIGQSTNALAKDQVMDLVMHLAGVVKIDIAKTRTMSC